MASTGIKGPQTRLLALALTVVTVTVLALSSAANASGDTTPPSAPQNLHTTTTSESTIGLAWNPSTDNVAVDHYSVYRDGSLVGTAPASAAPSYTDTGLWPHSTHSYYVSATDTSNNTGPISALITGYTKNDITPPTAPTNLTATFNPAAMSVALTWGASTDNVYVDHYDIYRSLVKIGSVPTGTLSWTDTTPPANSTFKYLVLAVDEFYNNSLSSNQPQVTTDILPPSAVTDLRIAAATTNSASLAWSPSIDNFSVQSYDIYRNGTKIANQSSASGTTFYAGGLNSGSTYTFNVIARDPTGNQSPPSNNAVATTGGSSGGDTSAPTAPSNLGALVSSTTVNLAWSAATDNVGVTSYTINRNGVMIATTNTVTYKDSNAPDNTDVAYTVTASDAAGNTSAQSNEADAYVDTQAPDPPTGLTAKDAGGSNNLAWSAASDNVGIKKYSVYRDGMMLGTTTAVSWVDTGAPDDEIVAYTVTATDPSGNVSDPSNPASVTTAKPPSSSSDWFGGYLSDLTPSASTNGAGAIALDQSNGGNTLKLEGVEYAKGLGMVAPASMSFDLGGRCSTFTASVGVDDEVGSGGSVDFQLWADGAKIWDSYKMTGTTATKDVSKSLTGKQTLELQVLHVGTKVTTDSADWVLPRLTCTNFLSDATPTSVTGPFDADANANGNAMAIGAVGFSDGIGVMAPSSIMFQLNGQCTTFSATVGLDEAVGSGGSVAFQLFADGKKVYDSGQLTGADSAVNMSKSVSGKQAIELRVVHVGAAPTNDLADWANAKLVCNN
jgi:chitodextrinase